MISKHNIRFIRSLHQKEGRLESGMFAAGGSKITLDLLGEGFQPELLVATEEWIQHNRQFISHLGEKIQQAGHSEIERCSTLKSPQDVISVWRIPASATPGDIASGLVLALDDIQDPGNTGTIIRIAAWFGIHYILCSPACADLYNPKVIQASMGAFIKVKVIYCDLAAGIQLLQTKGFDTSAAVMDGESLDDFQPSRSQVVILGNESRGVSQELLAISKNRITIPSFSKHGSGIESLNVSTAASIICYESCKKLKYEQ
jgi:TrmH family RNA methyltransferase